jgi:hypothetical protein
VTPGDRLSEYQPSGVTPSYRQTVVHGWGTSLFRPASKSLLSCGNTGAPGRIRTCGLGWQTQLACAVFLRSSIPSE